MSRPTRDSAAGRAYLDLQNLARREHRGTQEVLTMYVVERWLSRLSRSEYVDDFILKGGMLLASFGSRRPTIDADALARNMASDQATVAARVAEIAALPDPEDGVEFVTNSLSTAIIRDDSMFAGVRVVMDARIATAQLKLRLDINFGDPVTPEPRMIELPALRPDVTPIRVLGYPIETVIAEKLATAIELGPANTRVRDYVDLHTLTGEHTLDFIAVQQALRATAAFRGTILRPLSETASNIADLRASTYSAYRRNLGVDGAHLPEHFTDVVADVIEFADSLVVDQDTFHSWDPRLRSWNLSKE